MDAAGIVRSLLDARLLSPGTIVDGDLTLRNVSRSNGVFLVSADGGMRFVVKGPPLGEGVSDQGSPERERRFYDRLAREPGLLDGAPVPHPVATLGELLVLAGAGSGETLEERYRRRGLSSDDAALLGHALAGWRRLSFRLTDVALPGRHPWVMSALSSDPPAPVVENAGAGQLAELLRPHPLLVEGLARLKEGWRTNDVVHGDIRWDNAVVEPDPGTGRDRVILVDWEYLDGGDFGWDVAGALADAVAFETTDALSAEEETFRLPTSGELSGLRSAVSRSLRTFGCAYREELGEPAAADLNAGIRFLPARVLQIGFLHAAWGLEAGLPSALALAGVAAALFEDPGLLSDSLLEPATVPAEVP
jgi:Phosphotransferase enzyme family